MNDGIKTIETQLNDARRLLDAAITEWRSGSKEYALNGVKTVCERLLLGAQEMTAQHNAEYAEIYQASAELDAPDKWEARDTALLLRPQGHCVSVEAPNGERWSV